MRQLLRAFFGLRRALRGRSPGPKSPTPPPDPRLEEPWLRAVLAGLGARYRLGDEGEDGVRILRRTGRARFNPMPVWMRSADRRVAADYEVRGHGPDALADARRILDGRVTGPLAELGLLPARDSVEDWAGTVLTRRYQGACEDPERAAAAVRFLCVGSELQIDTAAE